MEKFIELSPSEREIEKVLINIDQIVAVEKWQDDYCIWTTAIRQGYHANYGSASVCYHVYAKEFEEKFSQYLSTTE